MSVKRMSTSTKRALNSIIVDAQGVERIVDDAITVGNFTPTEALAKIAVEVGRIKDAAWRVLQSHHEDKSRQRTGTDEPS